MRTESFQAAQLVDLFRRCKIATMPELQEALGTDVDVTVFRKLKELGYRTSYSHRRAYYTLKDIALFNDLGLWSFRSVRFSRYGTLVNTCEAFVSGSEAGYFPEELDNALHVETKAALLNLFRGSRLSREEVTGRYLYCSVDAEVQQDQLATRQSQEWNAAVGRGVIGGAVPDELRARIILYFSLLDEKQRRLYAGLESLKLGYGGDRKVAEFLGIEAHTVARGREQLLSGDFEHDRVRKPGAGRKPAEKKRPK